MQREECTEKCAKEREVEEKSKEMVVAEIGGEVEVEVGD